MGRKPPSSRKRKPRQELVEDIFAAYAAVAGTVEAAGPAPPSFIREGYISLTEATATMDGGWPEIRQHLCAKRVQGFIVDNENRLRRMTADDWASPKNNDASRTGWAVKLNSAILGGRDLEGFALVRTSDFVSIKLPVRAPLPRNRQVKPGRPSHRSEVRKAFNELVAEKRINFEAAKNKTYEPIRKRVRNNLGNQNLKKGLGNEAIRNVISQPFDIEKSKRQHSADS